MLFLDFSSAFTTIQPHLLMRKLMVMDTNPVIIRWLCSLLTDRPQRVVVKSSTTLEVSSEVRTNTGAPQGCVLSPALFTLYTSDCRCTARDTLQVKFSDDTSLTGLITTSENSYRCAVEKLVGWCQQVDCQTASRLIGRPVPDLQAHFEAKAIKRLEAIHCAQNCRPTLRQDLED